MDIVKGIQPYYNLFIATVRINTFKTISATGSWRVHNAQDTLIVVSGVGIIEPGISIRR